MLAAAGGPGSGLWDAAGTLLPWESLGRPICTGSAHVSSTKQAVPQGFARIEPVIYISKKFQ